MTDLQRTAFAVAWTINMDRMVHTMDPRLSGEEREAYLARASKLATAAAYDVVRHAPGEA